MYGRNENIKIALIVDEMRENKFKWLEHDLMGGKTEGIRVVKGPYIEEKRGR